jgi:hypothetical protein
MASRRVGQETFRNSPVVSRKKDWIGLLFLPFALSAKVMLLTHVFKLAAKMPLS